MIKANKTKPVACRACADTGIISQAHFSGEYTNYYCQECLGSHIEEAELEEETALDAEKLMAKLGSSAPSFIDWLNS